MKKVIILAIACVILSSCGPRTGAPVAVESADAVDYEVKFLFEKNGVSVFRFIDGGERRYFTIGNGSFQPQMQTRTITTSNGKSTTTRTEKWSDGAETR